MEGAHRRGRQRRSPPMTSQGVGGQYGRRRGKRNGPSSQIFRARLRQVRCLSRGLAQLAADRSQLLTGCSRPRWRFFQVAWAIAVPLTPEDGCLPTAPRAALGRAIAPLERAAPLRIPTAASGGATPPPCIATLPRRRSPAHPHPHPLLPRHCPCSFPPLHRRPPRRPPPCHDDGCPCRLLRPRRPRARPPRRRGGRVGDRPPPCAGGCRPRRAACTAYGCGGHGL